MTMKAKGIKTTILLFMTILLYGCGDISRLDETIQEIKKGFDIKGIVSEQLFRSLNITHVIAINPSSQNRERIVIPIGGNGSFKFSPKPHQLYVIVFINNSKIGAEKIVGFFRSDTLDGLASAVEDGEVNLGELLHSGEIFSSSIKHTDLLASLGLGDEIARALGKEDDICLRYINPDIDGDGILDAEQPDRDLRLDFHVGYNMKVLGNMARVDSIVGAYLPDTVDLDYVGTGVYSSFPARFYNGSFIGASVTLGNTPATTTDITGPNYGDYLSLGPYIKSGTTIPQGTYLFKFGGKTLTFTRVATRTDAEFKAATGIIMPFIKINQTDPSCQISSGSCTLASIDYKWMKRTASNWIPATLQELKLFVSDGGGYVSFRKNNQASATIGITLPISSMSGTINWKGANANLGGVTAEAMEAMSSSHICHLGLSYDDKLGMRIFSGLVDGAACPHA
jgi:hypothetical protein